jgi:hypothetical protein
MALDDAGYVMVESHDLYNGATDSCGVATITSGETIFGCQHVGQILSVKYSINDRNGHNGTCITSITIEDSTVGTMFLRLVGFHESGAPFSLGTTPILSPLSTTSPPSLFAGTSQ